MRTSSLAAAIVAGALLAGCSKPEPDAGGAPSPNAVTVDSAKPTDSVAAAVMPDSTKKDSTMNAAKDTAAAATPDTSKKN
jgi:PBP1b-binding outer membrane lipoprotein LpoB